MTKVQKCAIIKTIVTIAVSLATIAGLVLYLIALPLMLGIYPPLWIALHLVGIILLLILTYIVFNIYEHQYNKCNFKINGVPIPREEPLMYG